MSVTAERLVGMSSHTIPLRDTYRWQIRSTHALLVMLEYGADQGLPAIQWTIAESTGALIGDVAGLLRTPEEQRSAFEAWANYLDAQRSPERVTNDGIVNLNALFSWRRDERSDMVKGAIRARIFPKVAEEEEQTGV